MMRVIAAAALAALSLAACGPKAEEKPIDISGGSGCPDDGPRLPDTDICQGRAWAYLEPADGAAVRDAPEGCTWSVGQTMLAGDEALLYRTASCAGAMTTLTYAGGAHHASLAIGDAEVIQLHGVDPDPQGALKAALAALPAAERGACAIRPAGEGLPKDALVIARANGASCGGDAHWRIRQGYAWRIAPDARIDAETLTIIAKDAGGAWGAKP